MKNISKLSILVLMFVFAFVRMQNRATTETTAIENSDNTAEGQLYAQCILKLLGNKERNVQMRNGINGASCYKEVGLRNNVGKIIKASGPIMHKGQCMEAS
jgi:hypothetical protein